MSINQRWYKVGKHLPNGGKFYQHTLKPMTHKEACTFITKMMNPADWFLFEVDLNGEATL